MLLVDSINNYLKFLQFEKLSSKHTVISYQTDLLQFKSFLELHYKTDDIIFVQPYQSNTVSPNYGLNTFSFALSPQEYQSSRFCNFNNLNIKIMILKFNKIFINRNLKSTTIFLWLQCITF